MCSCNVHVMKYTPNQTVNLYLEYTHRVFIPVTGLSPVSEEGMLTGATCGATGACLHSQSPANRSNQAVIQRGAGPRNPDCLSREPSWHRRRAAQHPAATATAKSDSIILSCLGWFHQAWLLDLHWSQICSPAPVWSGASDINKVSILWRCGGQKSLGDHMSCVFFFHLLKFNILLQCPLYIVMYSICVGAFLLWVFFFNARHHVHLVI